MPRTRDSQEARTRGVPGGLGVKGHLTQCGLIDHIRFLIGFLCSYLIGLQFLIYSEILVENRSFFRT